MRLVEGLGHRSSPPPPACASEAITVSISASSWHRASRSVTPIDRAAGSLAASMRLAYVQFEDVQKPPPSGPAGV